MECYAVHYNAVEHRLDPLYYKPIFLEVVKRIKSLPYKVRQLKEIAAITCGPFGSSIKVKDYRATGVPLIRIANIDNNQELSSQGTIYISTELAEILKAYRVHKGDLLISQRGTLGAAVIVPDFFDNAIISANFIAIRKLKNTLPEYLKLVLSSKFGQAQIARKTSGQVQIKITTEDIKTLLIPLPSFRIQEKIVGLMQSAYEQKKKNDLSTEKLLASIDTYILDKLGITRSRHAAKMTFKVWSKEIENRLDPLPYHPIRLEAVHAIRSCHFKPSPLKDIVQFQRTLVDEIPDSLPYIGLENIEPNRGRFIKSKSEKESISSAFVFHANEILFPKLRPYLNKVFYADYDGVCSTEFHVLQADKCHPYYLFSFLSSHLVVDQTTYLMTGNTLPRLQTEDIERLLIPLPPVQIQEEISAEVKKRIAQARELENRSPALIEKARQQVEDLLLGKAK